MSKILVKCDFCKKEFLRERGEYNRNKKLGRKTFCSLSCTSFQNNIDRPPTGHPEFLIGHQHNRIDQYSPFRKFLQLARKRVNNKKVKEIDITLQDLKDQWELQNGICPFTGWKMELPINAYNYKKDFNYLKKATVDRIDSNKGYIKGNIQFVVMMANFAKNVYNKEEVIEFCKAVTDYNESSR